MTNWRESLELNRRNLSRVIQKVAKNYKVDDKLCSLEEINSGECDNFAVVVMEHFFPIDLVQSLFFREFNGARLVTNSEFGENLEAHVWIIYGGKHYDAEAPFGVKNHLELPIYQRQFHTRLNEIIREEYNHINYLKWKRQNVTLRGIRDNNSPDNGGMAKYGQGLYSAFLGNRELAKQYGKVYFLVNAIPKHPKVVYTTNDAEIFLQEVVTNFCKMHGVPRSNEFFSSKTTIADEMQRLGYDGLVIKGREMVNYSPPSNVLYFSTEEELKNYFDVVIEK